MSMNYDPLVFTPRTTIFVTSYIVGACVLSAIGIVGNSALLAVLLITKKSSSMNCLLIALTVVDIVYLSGSLAVVFLYDVDYLYDLPIRYSPSGVMSTWIILYVVRSSQMAGIWITVQISFERWLAVSRPLNGAFSVRKTKRLSAILIVVCILYELPGCLFANPSCSIEFEHNVTVSVSISSEETPCKLIRASWASDVFSVYYTGVSYAVLSFAIPLVFVVMFSLFTLRTIKRVRNGSIRLRNNVGRMNAQTQHTVMVLLISAMFLLFEVPSLICRTIQTFGLTDLSYFTSDDLYVAAAVCAILYATVNFVVYCICSTRFRRLCRIVLCRSDRMTSSASLSYVNRYPTIISGEVDRNNVYNA